MGFRRAAGAAGVGVLASLVFLIFAVVRDDDLGAPTGMVVGFALAALTFLLQARRR